MSEHDAVAARAARQSSWAAMQVAGIAERKALSWFQAMSHREDGC